MSDGESNPLLSFSSRSRTRPSISASITEDTPVPSSIVVDTSSISTISITTSNFPSYTQTSPTDPAVFGSATSSQTSTQPSSSATAAAASASQPVLTKPEIAGVTVGSVAAAGLVFGLLALFFCLRRRREKKRRASEASFGNDKIIVDQPRTPSSPPPGPAAQDVEHGIREPDTSEPYGQYAQAAAASPQSNRWSFWRKSTKPEDIGVAVAPGPAQQTPYDRLPVTPVSAASYETTSRLLPDKPTYSLYPPPLRLSSYNNHVSHIDPPGTQAVGFARKPPGPIMRPAPAPRGRGTMDTSQTHLKHGQPTVRRVPSDPFIDATSSSCTVTPRQYQTLRPQRPKAAAPAPVVVQYGQGAVHRKPVPARLPENDARESGQADRSNGIPASLSQLVDPTADSATSRGAAQPVRRKSSGQRDASGKRPVTFLSTSDTTFEDADSDDEPPPPLPKSILSPRSRPHAPGVRYPVIPTSAAASPSIKQTIREVPRVQLELNPASDRSKGKAKVSPKTPSPREKPVPEVPELAGSPLSERQQAPDSSSDRIKPGSAKYTILVAPGLEGIENVSTPTSKKSGDGTPLSTPTRRQR
ncbi:MAG: hypothetical protein Q9166_003750 [cf. Caloplaca sp. 2 TL-2023]